MKAYKPKALTAKQRLEAEALYRGRHDIYEVSEVIDSMQIALTAIDDGADDKPFSPYLVKARVKMARFVLANAYECLERLIDNIDNNQTN